MACLPVPDSPVALLLERDLLDAPVPPASASLACSVAPLCSQLVFFSSLLHSPRSIATLRGSFSTFLFEMSFHQSDLARMKRLCSFVRKIISYDENLDKYTAVHDATLSPPIRHLCS